MDTQSHANQLLSGRNNAIMCGFFSMQRNSLLIFYISRKDISTEWEIDKDVGHTIWKSFARFGGSPYPVTETWLWTSNVKRQKHPAHKWDTSEVQLKLRSGDYS